MTILLCVALILNELVRIEPDWPNAVMAVVAVLALFGAALQIHESKRSAATEIYAEYLKLAIEHSHYAIPERSSEARISSQSSRPTYDNKYSFYVSYLLLAAEEILETQHGDREWEETLKMQLMYHKRFIDERNELYVSHDKSKPIYSRKLIDLYSEINAPQSDRDRG